MDGVGQDLDAHGTHVSGIVAAVTNNRLGVAGTAPGAKVMPIKSLEDGSGSFTDIANGIRYAVDHGADVVNLSLGATPGTQALTITGLIADVDKAIAYAGSKGVLVVAAAGNETLPGLRHPVLRRRRAVRHLDHRVRRPRAGSPTAAIKPDLNSVAAPGGAGAGQLRQRHRLDGAAWAPAPPRASRPTTTTTRAPRWPPRTSPASAPCSSPRAGAWPTCATP